MTRTHRFIRGVQEILGLMQIDDDFIHEVRREVYQRCERVPVHKYKRMAAQEKIASEAREAIVDVFRKYYPERNVQIGRSWPAAGCVISMDEAIVELWIGIDYHDAGEGIEPIRIPVNRGKRGPDLSERIAAPFRKIGQRATGSAQPKPTPQSTAQVKRPTPKVLATTAPAKPKQTRTTTSKRPPHPKGPRK